MRSTQDDHLQDSSSRSCHRTAPDCCQFQGHVLPSADTVPKSWLQTCLPPLCCHYFQIKSSHTHGLVFCLFLAWELPVSKSNLCMYFIALSEGPLHPLAVTDGSHGGGGGGGRLRSSSSRTNSWTCQTTSSSGMVRGIIDQCYLGPEKWSREALCPGPGLAAAAVPPTRSACSRGD